MKTEVENVLELSSSSEEEVGNVIRLKRKRLIALAPKQDRESDSEINTSARAPAQTPDSLVPKLYEDDSDSGAPTLGGPLKAPKYHLPRWSGEIATYPDFIRSFKDFVHKRKDLIVPQKIQILEEALPKFILKKFAMYDNSEGGYKNRLRYLHVNYGDLPAIRRVLWKQITDQSPATDSVRSVADTLDTLVATVDKYRQYTEPVNEEQLFTTIIEKFPATAYNSHLRPNQRTVDNLFSAISEYVEIMRLSVNLHASSPTKGSDNRRQNQRRNENKREREKPYSRPVYEKRNDTLQPKGGRVYAARYRNPSDNNTRSSHRESNRDKSRSDKNQQQQTPKQRRSFAGYYGPGHYPPAFARIPVVPPPEKECTFCPGKHYSHLCTKVPTLEGRKKFIDAARLCRTCMAFHTKKVDHGSREEFCRWFDCVATTHHTNLCPKQKYPITEEMGHEWTRQLRQIKEAARLERDAEEGKGDSTLTPFSVNTNPLKNTSPTQNHVANSSAARENSGGDQILFRNLTEVQRRSLPQLSKYLNFSALTIASSHFLTFEAVSENPVTQYRRPLSGFLDSGSPTTYINEYYALDTLKLTSLEIGKMTIEGIQGLKSSIVTTYLVQLRIHLPRGGSDLIYAQTIPHVAEDLPQADLPTFFAKFPRYKKEKFAKLPKHHQIQILIGNEVMWRYVRNITQLSPEIQLLSTDLGYMIGGHVLEEPFRVSNAPLFFSTNDVIEASWSLDVLGIESVDPTAVEEETKALEQFYKTVRLVDNRYEVRWLYKFFPPPVADNFNVAFKRLEGQMKKLRAKPEFFRLYNEYFQQLLALNMIEYATEKPRKNPVHYLAHKGVYDPTKSTPLRVVYDGSAHSKASKYSLNECMLKGTNLLPTVLDILFHFRCHAVAVIADIRKAFHQISLHPDDRDVTRFLWLKDPSKPLTRENLIYFRYRVVPFGIITSPFLLNATLNHHFITVDPAFHNAHSRHLYVDNLITSVPTGYEGEELYKQSNEIFAQISMELAQWGTNHRRLREKFDPKHALDKPIVKVLGIYWDMQNDKLFLQPKIPQVTVFTKRSVLKAISSYYDPLGWFSPAYVPARSFLKRLWLEKFTWDQPLPAEYQVIARALVDDLTACAHFVFPRQYFEQGFSEKDITLHVFVDASMTAYSVVIYLVYTPPGSTAQYVQFLFGKARITPMTPLSVPKLELLAALIGARAVNTARPPLNLTKCETILWADSKCTLQWILGSKILSQFTRNRVNEIKTVDGLQFRHVSSVDNPADVGSRGCAAADLNKTLWWTGPAFLTSHRKEWPARFLTEEEQAEVDMTRESYWTLRHALTCHSKIQPLLPAEWSEFYDFALTKRKSRKVKSAKRAFFTFSQVPKQHVFTVKPPVLTNQPRDPSTQPSTSKEQAPNNTQGAHLEYIDLAKFPLHRFTNAENGMPFGFKIENYSSLARMLRHFTYWCKGFGKFAEKLPEKLGDLANFLKRQLKRERALLAFVYADQQIHFADLRKTLSAKGAPKFVKYDKHHFVLDKQGIIRSRNYLPPSAFIQDVLSPILLHPKSALLKLILLDIHTTNCHAGIGYTIASFRRHFFVPKAHKYLPQILRQECLKCKRADAKPFTYPENPDTQDFRTLAFSHPFTYTGVDIFGPFYVFDHFLAQPKTNKRQKNKRIVIKALQKKTSKVYKKWVLIFTCLSTRAVYLIAVDQLNTETIWTAFNTFFADRGYPRKILSDNAAQFRLLSRHLPTFWNDFSEATCIQDVMYRKDMTWHFTPAKAPWYGGLYERLIGVIKNAYYRIFGDHSVHAQTFQRTLKNLQVMINERPLCPDTTGNGQLALTPAHFLHANFGTFSIDCDRPINNDTVTAEHLIRIWKSDIEYLKKAWLAWKDEYLIYLRDKIPKTTASAYRTSNFKPKVGDLVLVLDFQTAPGKYKLATITNLHVSKDKQIRKVDIRFPSGALSTRAVKSLAPLETRVAPNHKAPAPVTASTSVSRL